MSQHDPLVARLRRALVHEEFSLHYQPLIEATSQRVLGAEALLRWHAPEIGDVPPGAVIPLAEDSGLIHAVTLAVLNQALAQCSQWNRRTSGMRVAVNLSPVCLKDATFPRRVATLLKAWSVPADRLDLELTARAPLDDPAKAAALLHELQAMGVRIMLDGFGNGNSSFQRLKELPFDGIKLERTYVQGLATNSVDRAIVLSLLNVARSLGCQAIATGVESEAAMRELLAAGCETHQGFWIGKPLSAAAFGKRWLAQPTSVLMMPSLGPVRGDHA